MEIMIVEDEMWIRDVLQSYFVKEGWNVQTSKNGTEALEKLKTTRFDLIVLDLMLPGMSGEEICQSIRKESNVPLIIISSKSQENDTINGLNLGADDYITKPFRVKEVVARVHALQRRISMMSVDNNTVLCFNNGRFLVNFEAKEAFVDGKPANLTMTEFKYLNILVKSPGKLYSRSDLSYEVQGSRYIGDGRTTDAHIKNIRRKIEPDHKKPVYITTKIGAGYKFNFYLDEQL